MMALESEIINGDRLWHIDKMKMSNITLQEWLNIDEFLEQSYNYFKIHFKVFGEQEYTLIGPHATYISICQQIVTLINWSEKKSRK